MRSELQVPLADTVSVPGTHRTVFSPLWWWQMHQWATCLAYGVAIYFLWAGRSSGPGMAGRWIFLAGLAGALSANTLRLHLWLTSRSSAEEWNRERLKVWGLTRLGDFLLGAALLLAGARHLESHPNLAALFLGSAIIELVGFAVIEPATTRAAARQLVSASPDR